MKDDRTIGRETSVQTIDESTPTKRTDGTIDKTGSTLRAAELWLQPRFRSASAITSFAAGAADIDFVDLLSALTPIIDGAAAGDKSQTEQMLVAQMLTLDAIFHQLTKRAGNNLGHNAEIVERYLRLAFKAQSQCRTTAESLSAIQNPSTTTFVRQANIGHAIQVNNGVEPPASPGRKRKQEVELLEASDGQRLDTRATGKAGRGDPTLAAVGKLDRPKNRRR